MSSLLIAYIGPETILPLTSVLAAIGGAAMMFWGRVRGAVGWAAKKLRGDSAADTIG
ncbi:hypothetical protein [Botrimarina sp.]|uniref:hypothetical protein n=1 Tax=Botrimarina sp. TaxID=2795802 RepID=UPI0032F04C3D